MSVVGVVGDVRQYNLSRAMPDWIPGAIYMPYARAVRALTSRVIAAGICPSSRTARA